MDGTIRWIRCRKAKRTAGSCLETIRTCLVAGDIEPGKIHEIKDRREKLTRMKRVIDHDEML